MSLLDNASLLLTPNAYKEGKLYSVIPSNGNGDFTATRATTATRVNSAGLVDLVPYNLLQRSEEFENAAWSVNTATVTPNTVISPSGLMNADTITNISGSLIGQNPSLAIIGQMYTFSIYIKRINGNGLINLVDINGNLVPITITNEWERYSVTATASSTSLRAYFRVMVAGDSIAAWGAQLVEGTSARDYLRTETRLNIPRLDYSLGGCPNILLEPQRTNLALQSSSFDSATWTKANSSVTANSTTSPSGIVDADTLTADGTTSLHITQQSISVVNATSYTISVYAKKNTNNFLQIIGGTSGFGVNVWANFDLNNGVVGSVGISTTARIENAGNGWYRCIIISTSTATTSAPILLNIVTSATSPRGETNTLSTSVFLWGAQLEAGAYATSYIPTTTASVTRNADSITRNNIYTNGLITAAGGTWFVELRGNVPAIASTQSELCLGIGANSNGYGGAGSLSLWNLAVGSSRIQILKQIGGVFTLIYTTTTDTTKIAIKWNGSTADVFANGVKVVNATAFAVTNMDFFFGSGARRNLFVNEMALFPTPLTDAQCLALTA